MNPFNLSRSFLFDRAPREFGLVTLQPARIIGDAADVATPQTDAGAGVLRLPIGSGAGIATRQVDDGAGAGTTSTVPTMGAGGGLAGIAPAGFDGVIDSGIPRRYRGPAAMRYEGKTRDWAQNAKGEFRSVHPNDQAMALSVLVRQGSIKSSIATGNTLFEITHLGDPDLKSDVENRIRISNPAKRLLAEGRVQIKRIDIDTSGNRLAVAVYYLNLEVSAKDLQTAKYYT